MMMPREIQKSLIEALLFMSSSPVSVNLLLRRLRKANRRWEESGNNQTSEASSEEPLSLSTDSASEELISPSDVTANLSDDVVDRVDTGLEENIDDAVAQDDVLTQLLDKSRELEEEVSKGDVKKILLEIQADYNESGRGFELVEVSRGWQLRTRFELAQFLREEADGQLQRLSPSSMETLSIVAYEQPVTRQKIEEVRGVDTGGVIKTLLEKGFVRIIGRSEEPGKPLVYGTTAKFLEIFSLNSLADLPSLKELEALQIETPMGDEIQRSEDESYFEEGELGASEGLIAGGLSDEDSSILAQLDASIKELTHVEREIFPQPQAASSVDVPMIENSSPEISPEEVVKNA